MKNNFLKLVSLALFLISCKQKKEVREDFYPNGKLQSRIVATKEGVKYTSFYENGDVESEGPLDRDLKKQGKWQYLNQKGVVTASGEFIDELRNGLWHYNIKDTIFSINWTRYINRPIKLNIPEGWIVIENPKESVPLIVLSDSINQTLGLDILQIAKNGEPFDSIVVRKTQYFNAKFPVIQESTSNVVINNGKAWKAVQYVMKDDRKIKTYRLYIDSKDVVYLLSFTLQQLDQEKFYTRIMEDMVVSFEEI